MRKFKAGNVISHIYLTILTLVFVFSLVWVIIPSLKGKSELTGNPTAFWPETWTFDYYAHVINDLKSLVNTRSSIIISLMATLIAIMVAALATYGIVRFLKWLGPAVSKVLVTAYVFSPILLAVPYSVAIEKLGLINTRIGPIIVYPPFSVPYAVWLPTGFFKAVPLEVKEAARIGGANKMQIFIQVVPFLMAPGVVATAIYTFVSTWSEFLYALILMNSTSKMTVAVVLRSLDGAETLGQGDMVTAFALVVLPFVIFFCLIRNKIAGGMLEGVVRS